MDDKDRAVSRVLVLGAEPETRQEVLQSLFKACGQETAPDASQGVHPLVLKTKYYTADLEVHVHAVEANELLAPLAHDADEYEALVWVVDAARDSSVDGTQQFVDNSIEELEFGVSLVVGIRVASATLVQVKRLEDLALANGFEFVAIDENGKKPVDDDEERETRGIERVKEALECHMWTSLQMLDKPPSARASTSAQSNQVSVTVPNDDQVVGTDDQDEETTPASKILVLGAELEEQHGVVQALADRSGGDKIDGSVGEAVHALTLTTKYYEANVELHLHRVETNELVTALHHDVEVYEALLWIVDASSDKSFNEVHHFVERSIEELTFDVSLVVGTNVDKATAAQVEALEKWSRDNGFEFVGVRAELTESRSAEEGKEGVDRVLEALHCNMWRSMKMLPREIALAATSPPVPSVKKSEEDTVPPPPSTEGSIQPPPPVPSAPMSHDDRLQASLAALSGAGLASDDDPEMEAFSGLFSQVQRIRESRAVLSDEERRRQAERVAMQLWNLLGADDDDSGQESD